MEQRAARIPILMKNTVMKNRLFATGRNMYVLSSILRVLANHGKALMNVPSIIILLAKNISFTLSFIEMSNKQIAIYEYKFFKPRTLQVNKSNKCDGECRCYLQARTKSGVTRITTTLECTATIHSMIELDLTLGTLHM